MASIVELGRYISELEIVLHYAFKRMTLAELEGTLQEMAEGFHGRGFGPKDRLSDAMRFVEREIQRRREQDQS